MCFDELQAQRLNMRDQFRVRLAICVITQTLSWVECSDDSKLARSADALCELLKLLGRKCVSHNESDIHAIMREPQVRVVIFSP